MLRPVAAVPKLGLSVKCTSETLFSTSAVQLMTAGHTTVPHDWHVAMTPHATSFWPQADDMYLLSRKTAWGIRSSSSRKVYVVVKPLDHFFTGTTKTGEPAASAGRSANTLGVPQWCRM